MRSGLGRLTCCTALGAACVALAALAQDAYRPAEGDFTAAFPMAPAVQTQPARRSHDVASRRYVDEEDGKAYMVSVDEYPPGVLPPAPNEAIYDKILQSFVHDDPQSLKSTRPARLSGRPCLEGIFINADGEVQTTRVLIIGDRLYRVSYSHVDGVDPPGVKDAFFSAFRITDPAAP